MASEITLRQLDYLVAAVDAGTMTAAGRRLSVSPSSISMGIAHLEQVLGTELLVRAPRRALTLTPSGHAVIGDVRQIVALTAGIVEQAGTSDPAGGVVRMGCFAPFSPYCVPDLVDGAAAMDPAVDIQVDEDRIESMLDDLLAGALDLLLLYADRLPDGLVVRPLMEHRPYVIMSAEHRLAEEREVQLADLIDEPMVVVRQRAESYFERTVRAAGLEPTIARSTQNMSTLRSMVARGDAWSILIGGAPHGGRSAEGRPLVAAAIADDVPPMPVVLAWREPVGDAPVPRRVQRVIDLCVELAPGFGFGAPPSSAAPSDQRS